MSKKTKKAALVVLVGTYRKSQLEKWVLPKGFYNYPVHDEDAAIRAAVPFQLIFGKAEDTFELDCNHGICHP